MRFQFEDYLGLFSVEDLRELAQRRGFLLSQSALTSRQTLVRRLSATLERPESIQPALFGLNGAELAVLSFVLAARVGTGCSRVSERMGLTLAETQSVLESLRRYGLLFPEGNWESIVVPPATRAAVHYVPAISSEHKGEAPHAQPPPLEPSAGRAEGRVASIGWDLAEFLARVARSRFKLTQAGRINRRDLKALETAFAVASPSYPTFLYLLAASMGLLTGWQGLLSVPEEVDSWLSLTEGVRQRTVLGMWAGMRAFPENSTTQPDEAEYVSLYLLLQRSRMLELLPEVGSGASVESIARRLAWSAPLALQQWDSSRDPALVARRLLRSLYWLGVVALDDPEAPKHVALTPAGLRALELPEAPNAIPEEPAFFLQPNAEIFAPPNLQPRTLFHLRRVTGEKKGGAAGTYPLTTDSLRRALDAGLTVSRITEFLERFSRTGLPPNVRALVETTGRQHGRIRLVPAGYVVVTEDPQLMEELRSLKTVSPLLGEALTERVAALDAENSGELLKRLRARGYAPLDAGEIRQEIALPDDPEAPQTDLQAALTASTEGGLDWSRVENDTGEDGEEDLGAGEKVSGREQIVELLEQAIEEGLAVEIGYHSRYRKQDTERVIWPEFLDGGLLEAYCTSRDDHRQFAVSRIYWARLTGDEIPEHAFEL